MELRVKSSRFTLQDSWKAVKSRTGTLLRVAYYITSAWVHEWKHGGGYSSSTRRTAAENYLHSEKPHNTKHIYIHTVSYPQPSFICPVDDSTSQHDFTKASNRVFAHRHGLVAVVHAQSDRGFQEEQWHPEHNALHKTDTESQQ